MQSTLLVAGAITGMLMLGYALYSVVGWWVLMGLIVIPFYVGLAWWLWLQVPPFSVGNPPRHNLW